MRYFTLPLLLTVLLSALLLCACKEPEPIRIGFLGELTGRSAGLGTSGRDGFLLAIEEANRQGGIGGQLVAGVIHDTRMDQQSTVEAVNRMSEQGVVAIVGPMTSQTAVAATPAFNRTKIPAISPTVSSNQLSDLNDYFFRVYYTNAQAASFLAQKMVTRDGLRRVAAIYDTSNRAYTEDWLRYFREAFAKLGGTLQGEIPFDSNSNPLFTELTISALAEQPEALLLLANAVDTAMICQQVAKQKVTLPRYATGWSYSDELMQFGGKSVEGLVLLRSADFSDQAPSVQRFVQAFQKRFKEEPNFPALHAYDATRILLSALKESSTPSAVRQALLETASFEGTQASLSFNQYGDLRQPKLHVARIEGARFIKVD